MDETSNIIVGAFGRDRTASFGMLIRDNFPMMTDDPFAALIDALDAQDSAIDHFSADDQPGRVFRGR